MLLRCERHQSHRSLFPSTSTWDRTFCSTERAESLGHGNRITYTTDHHVRTFGWTRSMDLKSHSSLPTSVDAAKRSEKFETKDRSRSGRCARRSISINRTINHLIRLASHTIPFHLRVMRGIFQGSTVNILISAIHNLAWECGKDNVDEHAISMHRCRT